VSEEKKIHFAIVGVGYIGKRHAEIILLRTDAILVAIADIDIKENDFAVKNDIPFFTSLAEMLAADITIDVVCIATPNGLHAQHALLALSADKHVLIEKPIALTKVDCEDVIGKALEMDKQVFCVMQNRYSPPSIWLKEMVDGGKLGSIFMVQINCFWNRDDRYYTNNNWKGTADLDGGTLFTQFSHFIDMMYWLFGDIKNIKASFKDFAHAHSTTFEDSGIVQFDFEKSGIGSINYSTAVWDKNLESSITIIAENGSIKVGGQYMNEVEYCHVKDYQMPTLPATNPANDYGIYKGSAANHLYVFDNVVGVLKGDKTIAIKAEEAMKVVEIIEGIYKLR
jgi:UDP-N-acetyl-2-amino-2-deoxyglucuronate dehydrogenase